MELVEVLENARSKGGEIAVKMPKGGIKLSKNDLILAMGGNPGGGKKKKKKKGRKRSQKLDPTMMLLGAVAAAATEMYVIQGPQVYERIPPMLRRWSGFAMLAVGWAVSNMKKIDRRMKSFFVGYMLGGAYTAAHDMIKRQRDDWIEEKFEELVEEGKKLANEGLGYWPPGPRLSYGQAANALGMQSRVPYNPHSLPHKWAGDLGAIAWGAAPLDESLNPVLQPGGLGVLDMHYGGDLGRPGGGLGYLDQEFDPGQLLAGQFYG